MSADSFDFWLGTWDVSWDDSSDRMTLERVSGSAEA